jgi:hypothetical protein
VPRALLGCLVPLAHPWFAQAPLPKGCVERAFQLSDGFMLDEDAQQLMQEADASTIGKLGATITP